MKLSKYLIENGITTEQFARKMKVSYSTVCKWRTGVRTPDFPDTVAKIAKVTNGVVTADDWKKKE